MMSTDRTVKIAGAAGQGMQTIGFILGKVLTRSGLHVFAVQDNESRIRGGHNFFQLRVSANHILSMTEGVDVLVALNQNGVDLHQDELSENGIIIFDSEKVHPQRSKDNLSGIPLEKLATEHSGKKMYFNAVALGAVIGILKSDFKLLADYFAEFFAGKSEVSEANSKAAKAGFDYVNKHYQHLSLSLSQNQNQSEKMFINGNEAIALGAITAGCQFFAAYPMSPSTSILTYLASKADQCRMIVEQAEDEISAVTMAIGASFTGVRSMTATSGGGFSLMVESLGFAGVSETPLVIVNAQRPGPATGLPTRTEQSDLRFVLHASQGEFPRIILAPGTAREAFYSTLKAFHLAYKYQLPVILLTDQYLADSYFTEEQFEISHQKVETFFPSPAELSGEENYLRYRFTETGVSPRIPPSWEGYETIGDSHEHSEDGHITEDPIIRTKMVEKRSKKLKFVAEELDKPQMIGPENGELVLVGWGSTFGVLKEVVETLVQEGISIRLMHFLGIWPFPVEVVKQQLNNAKRWFAVENNYNSQLSGIIQELTGNMSKGNILKWDGRPLFKENLLNLVRKELTDETLS
jgi:2-oxoglutarate ferredoxin oxidoreductase subunit alpha